MYGRSSELCTLLQDNEIGYVMRAGYADTVVASYLGTDTWQVCGSRVQGERRYDWAWVATINPQHYMLIHRHMTTGELAFHYCYVPES